jgi:hypothetical protein
MGRLRVPSHDLNGHHFFRPLVFTNPPFALKSKTHQRLQSKPPSPDVNTIADLTRRAARPGIPVFSKHMDLGSCPSWARVSSAWCCLGQSGIQAMETPMYHLQLVPVMHLSHHPGGRRHARRVHVLSWDAVADTGTCSPRAVKDFRHFEKIIRNSPVSRILWCHHRRLARLATIVREAVGRCRRFTPDAWCQMRHRPGTTKDRYIPGIDFCCRCCNTAPE